MIPIMAYMVKTALTKNKLNLDSVFPESIRLELIRMFPENLFFDTLQLYPETHPPCDWENLDELSFQILADTDLNSLAYQGLTRHFQSPQVADSAAVSVVLFTNWIRNYPLSEDLITRFKRKNLISQLQHQILSADLAQRKQNNSTSPNQGIPENFSVLQMLAHQVGIDPESFSIGENLIPGGSFLNKESMDAHWLFSDMSDSDRFSKGSFYGNFDTGALRVLCFFTSEVSGRQVSRGGFWHKHAIPLEKGPYVFGFKYRTLLDSESPTFWLDDQFKKEWKLEPTSNEWKQVVFFFDNAGWNVDTIQPLLRMFGPGSVWFDDVCLYKIKAEGDLVAREILFIQ